MKKSSNHISNSSRIDIADVLRGLAVLAIVLLHSIEHFNFYSYPETDNVWLKFADKSVWNSLFFAFGGKTYAIFALLFGFSYYIQEANALKRDIDFRARFMWRLLLLLLIAQVNAAFFTGEVLVLYATVGFMLPLFSRCSTKAILIVAIILMLQPMEWGKMIYAIMNPDLAAPSSLGTPFWRVCRAAQEGGGFLEMVKVNLIEGQLASLTWAFENARFFQTPALFLFGMLIGRKKLFSNTEKNNRFWLILFVSSLIMFFPFNGVKSMLSTYIDNRAILKPMSLIIGSLSNFFFMNILVGGTILMYNKFKGVRKNLNYIIPYGRMSLTNYITQSIIGAMLFYNWGIKLELGAFHSLLVGIVILTLQFTFCHYWMKRYKHGPLEWLWKRLTWIQWKKR